MYQFDYTTLTSYISFVYKCCPQVGTFAVESDVIRLPSVDDQIADSERRGMRYTIVVGRRSAASRVLTLYVFRPNTAREGM